jgi:nitrite reductase/ring-hydroxylating ferredoxin subunit
MQPTEKNAWKDLPNAPAQGFVLARLADLVDGGAYLTSVGGDPQVFHVVILRSGNEVFAYVNQCMHFGVPLALTTQYLGIKPHVSIRCNVHYARYRWRDGFCESGDCEGESLMAIPVRVVAGEVLVSEAEK